MGLIMVESMSAYVACRSGMSVEMRPVSSAEDAPWRIRFSGDFPSSGRFEDFDTPFDVTPAVLAEHGVRPDPAYVGRDGGLLWTWNRPDITHTGLKPFTGDAGMVRLAGLAGGGWRPLLQCSDSDGDRWLLVVDDGEDRPGFWCIRCRDGRYHPFDVDSETSHAAGLERALSGKSPVLSQVRPEDYL